MSHRGVIFDVDGVLVDSYQAHFASWRRLAAENGLEFTEARFSETFGRTSREILELDWPERFTPEEIRRLDDRKESLYREEVAAAFPEMPGANRLIDALAAAGFRLAVGSSGPPENVQLVLERLGRPERFSAVVTGRDVTRGKPDPQVFLLAAERLGLSPGRCLVIEDAPAGIEAAHAAGMTCLALASTGRTPEQLQAAERVVATLEGMSTEEITALLAR